MNDQIEPTYEQRVTEPATFRVARRLIYLQGLHAGFAGRVRVKVRRTPTDLGIKDVCKETLNQARGEFLCLLNKRHGGHARLDGCADFARE